MSTDARTVVVSSRSSLRAGPSWGRRAVMGAGVAAALTALARMTIGEDRWRDHAAPQVMGWRLLLEASYALYAGRISATAWQEIAEELFRSVEPGALAQQLQLDTLLSKNLAMQPIRGAAPLPIAASELYPGAEQLPVGLSAKLLVFRAGRAMPPHAHDNVVALTYVMRGRFRVRHYARVRDDENRILIKPTLDRILDPSNATSFSDSRDNVHWHEALTDGILFVVYCKDLGGSPSKQLMVDPVNAEQAGGGLLLAPRLPSLGEALERFG